MDAQRVARNPLIQLVPVAVTVLLPALALVFAPQYLLFHTLAELFVASVALVVFSIAWHTRRIASSDYLTFIGMSSLPFALVIVVHALSYKGMPTFPFHDADLPTQLWLVARVIQASAFVIAPWYARRHLRHPGRVLLAYSLVALLGIATAVSGDFPVAFIEGRGLTPFKIWTEYAVMAAMVASAAGLAVARKHVEAYVRVLLYLAMASIFVAELAFTLYTDPFGMWNRVGHVLHVMAAVAIYGALVHSSLEEPLSTLFLRLRRREAELAEAYQEEHDIAETLQSAMAVEPSTVAGVALAHCYLPAPGIGRIGGDFYDVFRVSDTLVGFVIGDVCGKGVRAATTAFRVRNVVRGLALANPVPTTVLEQANTYLMTVLPEDSFVTAAYGTIDTTTGEVCYALAGHLDPLLCGHRNAPPDDDVRAMPLGIMSPLHAGLRRLPLAPGDALVLVTDGVTEAKRGSELFGIDRLEGLLAETGCELDADAVVDLVVAEVRRFTGRDDNTDDIAVVALRFVPGGSSSD